MVVVKYHAPSAGETFHGMEYEATTTLQKGWKHIILKMEIYYYVAGTASLGVK